MREASAEDRRDLLGYLSSIYATPNNLSTSVTTEETQAKSKSLDTQSTDLEE